MTKKKLTISELKPRIRKMRYCIGAHEAGHAIISILAMHATASRGVRRAVDMRDAGHLLNGFDTVTVYNSAERKRRNENAAVEGCSLYTLGDAFNADDFNRLSQYKRNWLRQAIKWDIRIALAGEIAGAIAKRSKDATRKKVWEATADYRIAKAAADDYLRCTGKPVDMERLHVETYHLVIASWDAIRALAKVLTRPKQLTFAEAYPIISRHKLPYDLLRRKNK